MTQSLAIFDLDGTLVRCQTQRIFLEYCSERRYIGNVTRWKLLCWFGLYKAGILSEPRRAMEYAYRFAEGWSMARLEQEAEECFRSNLLPYLCLAVTKRVEAERNAGRNMVLVSNSIDPLAGAVARFLGFDGYVSTRLETKNGRCTGQIDGAMVYGEAKVRLVREYAEKNGLSLSDSSAYADHISDLPVLEMAARPVAVNPCRKLHSIATARNWEIVAT
ncbi:MAG: HAD-IB family hydrolase [Rhodocyclales bacterium]|nr:HAD-IB family hydrolase [Rhodocyclales bacterium]